VGGVACGRLLVVESFTKYCCEGSGSEDGGVVRVGVNVKQVNKGRESMVSEEAGWNECCKPCRAVAKTGR
jgi:hypothetical protein